MLLRRAIEHVRDQNWFAVGIDFVIVVVGVFIGIQVANFNAARIEAAKADSYLQRLHQDVSDDIVMLQQGRAWEIVRVFHHASNSVPLHL